MMRKCASQPQASAGAGTSRTASRRASSRVRMPLIIPLGPAAHGDDECYAGLAVNVMNVDGGVDDGV